MCFARKFVSYIAHIQDWSKSVPLPSLIVIPCIVFWRTWATSEKKTLLIWIQTLSQMQRFLTNIRILEIAILPRLLRHTRINMLMIWNMEPSLMLSVNLMAKWKSTKFLTDIRVSFKSLAWCLPLRQKYNLYFLFCLKTNLKSK